MEGWDGIGKRAFLGLLSAFVFETNTGLFLAKKRKIGNVLVCKNTQLYNITNVNTKIVIIYKITN